VNAPWRLARSKMPLGGEVLIDVYEDDADGRRIAGPFLDGDGRDEATARLIAAAPSLLAALNEVQRTLAYVVPRTNADRVRLMRTIATVNASIAKAEGR